MSEVKNTEKVDEIEVSEDLQKAIAESVKAGIADEIKSVVAESVKDAIASATEKTIKKEIEADGEGKKENEGENEEDKEEETKELSFMRAAYALKNGNLATVQAYNEKALEARRKAGYGNTATDADGGYLVSDPDFDAAVECLEETYGVAFGANGADVKQVNGNAVKLNKKSAGFEFTEVSEHGATPGVKISIGQVLASLRKFRAIAPITDELDEDMAVDYWEEVTKEFALARAKKADQIVFTDAVGDGVNANTVGIVEVSGTANVSELVSDPSWDTYIGAEGEVPTDSETNGAWYMHRKTYKALCQIVDDGGRYQFTPNPKNPVMPWGTPIVLTEVMPTPATVEAGEAYAIFGDLKRTKLYVKRGLQLEMLREATVKDAAGADFNLALNGGKAMLGWTRMLSVVKFPEAYCLVLNEADAS